MTTTATMTTTLAMVLLALSAAVLAGLPALCSLSSGSLSSSSSSPADARGAFAFALASAASAAPAEGTATADEAVAAAASAAARSAAGVDDSAGVVHPVVPDDDDGGGGGDDGDAVGFDGFTAAERIALAGQSTKHSFEAEVDSVMRIIINNIYSNTEIFLRELISNASDALDRIRFRSLTDESSKGGPAFAIHVRAGEDAHTIEVSDTGIGMTGEELVSNLGTIARSGTSEFLRVAAENPRDSNIIGQFGVGFYSMFLVADEVTVVSKSNDDPVQHRWHSGADGSFTVAPDPHGNTIPRGTRVILKLKEEAWDYARADALEGLVKKYSEFITFPIFLWASEERDAEVPLTEAELEKEMKKCLRDREQMDFGDEDEDGGGTPSSRAIDLDAGGADADADADAEAAEHAEDEEFCNRTVRRTKMDKEVVWDWHRMNPVRPIWTRNPREVTEEEYTEFFRQFTKDDTAEPPLMRIHFLAEGEVEFKSLLFIPGERKRQQAEGVFDSKHSLLKLYVKRVFITDDFRDILPRYLGFITGVIDSDDLPLNLSREMLQQHRILKSIKKKIVRKAISMFQQMAEAEEDEERERYLMFWRLFGANVKLGVIEDNLNRQRLSKLIMFHSSRTGEYATLADYAGRMKEDQQEIYFLAGEDLESLRASPLVEKLNAQGYEVLFGVEPIDEYCLSGLEKFDGKYRIVNIAKDGVRLPGERQRNWEKEYRKLTKFLRRRFSENVSACRISRLLVESPSALVASSSGFTANQERIQRAQALRAGRDDLPVPKRILEINPRHPLVHELKSRLDEFGDDDATVTDVADLMYDVACLQSGYPVRDTASFSKKVVRIMNLGLGLDPDATPEEYEWVEKSFDEQLDEIHPKPAADPAPEENLADGTDEDAPGGGTDEADIVFDEL